MEENGTYVNVKFCEQIRRIVVAVVERTGCDAREAMDEVAKTMNMDPGSVRLAIAVTQDV